MSGDKRKRLRAHAGFEITVLVENEKVQVHTINLSLTGLLCTAVSRFREGAPCLLTLTLNRETEIIVEGRILRSDPQEAAIGFTSMDEQSFGHLKKLVSLNTGDADRVDSELQKTGFTAGRC